MSLWTENCPVCGEALPQRGARRLYVSWKRGFRRVHAGPCAEAIEAQGVLVLAPPKPQPPAAVTLVRMRQIAELGIRDAQRPHESFESVRALMRRIAAGDVKPLVRGPLRDRLGGERLNRQQLLEIALGIHAPKYSRATGQVLATEGAA